MKPCWNVHPYVMIAITGTRNKGARRAAALPRANAPQKKISTHKETAIFSAQTQLSTFPKALSIKSKATLFHCGTIDRPGNCPWRTSSASHAL
jgi:hypothetical protein